MTKELTVATLLNHTVEEGECLIWTGNQSRGIPKIQIKGQTFNVRREVYKQVYGEIPDGHQAGVRCKTPLCGAGSKSKSSQGKGKNQHRNCP